MLYPVSKPFFDEEERSYLLKAFDSGWISSAGDYIKKFEYAFAHYCERKYAITVCNGTEAIHLALLALGIRPGDEVIVPSFTFIASVNPICYVGANPIFVDINLKSLTVDIEDFKNKITRRTKATILVPLYGHPVDYDPILKICKEKNILVIEDAAEAHGTKYKGKKTGQFGDISCFSFYGNKIITTGEGGMVLTDDKQLFVKMAMLKNHGMSIKKYIHPIIGYNLRMTNLQAAIGYAQLLKIDKILIKRKKIYNWYNDYLEPALSKGMIELQPQEKWAELNNWFFSILLNKRINRDHLIANLENRGIDSRPFFYPVHKQKSYKEFNRIKLRNTESVYKRGLNLPTYHQLEEEDVRKICNILVQCLKS